MRLSVALCTYNGSRYLGAQLDSLVAQSRPPDELIACDDGSTDGTVDVLAQFAARAPFPVHVHRNATNLGSTRNFDQAIGLCSGNIIALCDQDDLWHPDKLARFVDAFSDPTVGLVASDLELIGSEGKSLGRRVWTELPFSPDMRRAVEAGHGPDLWVRYNTITGAAAAFRADLRDLVRPIPPPWVHDGWIAIVAAAVSSVRLIADPLTSYREHTDQQIGSQPLTLRRQIRSARRMDAAYFERAAACFAAVADRLDQHLLRVNRSEVVSMFRMKAAFSGVQARMRRGTRIGRVAPAVRELGRGSYHRFGRGLKGFAADLLL